MWVYHHHYTFIQNAQDLPMLQVTREANNKKRNIPMEYSANKVLFYQPDVEHNPLYAVGNISQQIATHLGSRQ
jgi:hypothetical protein